MFCYENHGRYNHPRDFQEFHTRMYSTFTEPNEAYERQKKVIQFMILAWYQDIKNQETGF